MTAVPDSADAVEIMKKSVSDLVAAGRIDDAICALESAIGTRQEDATLTADLAVLLWSTGRIDSAKQWALRSLGLHPDGGVAGFVMLQAARAEGVREQSALWVCRLATGPAGVELRQQAQHLHDAVLDEYLQILEVAA